MAALYLALTLLTAGAAGCLGALLLRLVPYGRRAAPALAVLAAPVSVVGFAVLHLVLESPQRCPESAAWDRGGSAAVLLVIGAVASGALVLNLLRAARAELLLLRCPPLGDEDITRRAGALAARFGISPPSVCVLRLEAPLAATGGLRRTGIVLSSWVVEHLDARELDAVLAHEMAHLVRHDPSARLVGRLLRDTVAYLPGGWYACAALEADQELRADALAAEVTRRPLALASALCKVWLRSGTPAPATLGGLPGLTGSSGDLLEERVRRLAGDGRRPAHARLRAGGVLAGAGALSLGGLAPRLLASGAGMVSLVCHSGPF